MTDIILESIDGVRDLTLRLTQVARNVQCAEISVKVFVSNGQFIGWEEPIVTKLEPQSRWSALLKRAFNGAGTA